jgi:hypothetical protein
MNEILFYCWYLYRTSTGLCYLQSCKKSWNFGFDLGFCQYAVRSNRLHGLRVSMQCAKCVSAICCALRCYLAAAKCLQLKHHYRRRNGGKTDDRRNDKKHEVITAMLHEPRQVTAERDTAYRPQATGYSTYNHIVFARSNEMQPKSPSTNTHTKRVLCAVHRFLKNCHTSFNKRGSGDRVMTV